MPAYADVHSIDTGLFSGNKGVCYGVSSQNDVYKCQDFYLCGNNPTMCSGGGGCVPRCDSIPQYYERSGLISKYHNLKNGESFTHNNKKYFCCLPSGKTWGSFAQQESWTTTEKKEKTLGGGGRCYYDVTTDACGNVTQGDCSVPTECVGNTILRNNECIVPCTEYESETSNKCKAPQCTDGKVLRNNECITPCKEYESETSNKCKAPQCTDGKVLRNNECIVPCEEYESETSNKCKPKCTGNTILRNNECIVPCEEYESETSNKCKQITSCNSGTEIYDSVNKRCANKSEFASISQDGMKECFACTDNKNFKLCALYKCYENANNNMCNSVTKNCLLNNN